MPPKEGGIAVAAAGADPKHARSFCAEAKPKKINEIKNRVSKDQFTVEYQWVRRTQSVAATRPLIIGLPAREPAQESEGANAGDARTNQGEGPHARSNHFLRRASLVCRVRVQSNAVPHSEVRQLWLPSQVLPAQFYEARVGFLVLERRRCERRRR